MISLYQLLKACVKQGASDLHIVANSAPVLRVNGKVVRVKTKKLNEEDVRKLCYSILTDYQKSHFEEHKEMDFSFGIKNMARFRANMFYQKGNISGVFRRVPLTIPPLKSLGLPDAVESVTKFPSGLVLVTGPTGCGKTTTIASMLDQINSEKRGHIVTLEDPIEFIHEHKNCIVNQREIGNDTESFKVALKYLLRQDPDICLVGELRDFESMDAALHLAETGHLVFATLHTNSAAQTISRLVGAFPGDQQERVRNQLSFVLKGVISQRLIPTEKDSVVAAVEYLILTPGIQNLIRENKIHQVYGMMQVGQGKTGMMTMNQSLLQLVLKRQIEMRVAFNFSPDPEELDGLFKKAGI